MKQVRMDLILTIDDEDEIEEEQRENIIDKIINNIYDLADDVDIIRCEEI